MNTSIPSNTATATATTAAIQDNVDTVGNFFPYDSQLPIAEIPGTRVITCNYKQTAAMKKAGKGARNNVYVRVATNVVTKEDIISNIEVLADNFLALITAEQDEIIKTYHKGGGQRVYSESISLANVLSAWESKGASSLTGEVITEWFTETVTPELCEVLASKLDTDISGLTAEQSAKVNAICNSYLDSFISLASGKTQMIAAQRERLAKCMEITATGGTVVGAKLIARLERMAAKEQEALASLDDLEL